MKNNYPESSHLHVTGKSQFVDDISISPEPLLGFAITSPIAKGKIKELDYSEALKVKGITCIISYKDIPGHNRVGAVIADEPVLAEEQISHIGQAILLLAAENERAFIEAQKLVKIVIEPEEPILTIEQAKKHKTILDKPRKIERGDIEEGFKQSDYIIEGVTKTPAQEHWYLETHCSVAIPLEDNQIKIISSTQNPREVQIFASEVLNIPANKIEIEIRRIGGGFGGKETQGATFALWAALLAYKTQRPVKVRLERHVDQSITGKRHPYEIYYKVGFTKEGKILSADIELNSNAGYSADLSLAILERSLFHAENAYYIPNIRIIGKAWLTNYPSNTAFRGFGAPQAIFNIENIIEKIARIVKKDVAEVQKLNFYGIDENNIAPYGQIIKNNNLHKIYDRLIKQCDYIERQKQKTEFNQKNKYTKRGIATTPVKFGISFTTSFLNQAGALVNVYTDGSVLVNHGGVEMGQGLFTKIKLIAAKEFGISPEKVIVNATNTSKVPNTSATAASTGSDLNGMAVKDAIDKIKNNIKQIVCEYFNSTFEGEKTEEENLIFENNEIYDHKNPERRISFSKAANLTRLKQKSLSATGYYATPGIYFDREKGQGNPFYYYSYGMVVSEVEVDLLTGYAKILRTDIIHDVGESINEHIDKGQIYGAFVQCTGWCMLEEQKYDSQGRNITASPDTYKIPTINDIPLIFNVELMPNSYHAPTIQGSKAIGEPPFILGFSVWFAIKDALWSISNYEIEPNLNFPATNEHILIAVEDILNKIEQKNAVQNNSLRT